MPHGTRLIPTETQSPCQTPVAQSALASNHKGHTKRLEALHQPHTAPSGAPTWIIGVPIAGGGGCQAHNPNLRVLGGGGWRERERERERAMVGSDRMPPPQALSAVQYVVSSAKSINPPSAMYSALYPVIEDAQHIIDQGLFTQMKDKNVATWYQHDVVRLSSALLWP